MDPLTLSAIFGGVGLLKGATLDKAKEKRDRELQSATARYSPWTGLKARDVENADPIGSGLAFGSAGAQLGQNMQSASNANELNKAMAGYYKAQAAATAPQMNYEVPSIESPAQVQPAYFNARRNPWGLA
jgi:hypothetical protein